MAKYNSSLTAAQIEAVLSGVYAANGLLYSTGSGAITSKNIGTDIGYPIKTGTSAPGAAFPGAIGQFYFNFTSNDLYMCTDISNSYYTWKLISSRNFFIKYSHTQPTRDLDMKGTIDDWIGIYSGQSSEAPTSYTSYQWYQIKGLKGDTGSTGASGYSPSVSIATTTEGYSITITDDTHRSGQTFEIFHGTGYGDMDTDDYDADGTIASAGGITAYLNSQILGKIEGSY